MLLANSEMVVNQIMSDKPVSTIMASADSASDWSHPVYFSQPNDPLYTIHCLEAWGSCEVEGMNVRIPAAARPAAGSDGHLAVVDQETGWEYDFWQARDRAADGGALAVSWGGRTEITGDGRGSNATAAHFGLLAGIIRAAEMEAGRIDHALFMTVSCTADRAVYPALGLAKTCPMPTDAPAVGQHLWLDMSSDEIAALDVPDWKKTILRALAQYGGFIGDTGGNTAFAVQFESGTSYTSFGSVDPVAAFAEHQTRRRRPLRGWIPFRSRKRCGLVGSSAGA